MHREDDSNFLLFIEPPLEKRSVLPVLDENVQILRMAFTDAKKGCSNYDRPEDEEATFRLGCEYKGVHTSSDGELSAPYDLLLPNGMITNTLAIHYLMYYREAVPASDLSKLEELKKFYGRSSQPVGYGFRSNLKM